MVQVQSAIRARRSLGRLTQMACQLAKCVIFKILRTMRAIRPAQERPAEAIGT